MENHRSVDTQGPSQEKKSTFGIAGYIEKHILAQNESVNAKEEEGIRKSFAGMSASEKAVKLFGYLVSFGTEYQQTRKNAVDEQLDSDEEQKPPKRQLKNKLKNIADPYLVGEIKVLWSDEETKDFFLEKYTQALQEDKEFRNSDLSKKLSDTDAELEELEKSYTTLRQALNLQTVTRPTEVAATKSKLARVTRDLLRANAERERVMKLEGEELTEAHTDVAAAVMFNTLLRYHQEAETGFVQLPSRRTLHQKILDVIDGSGKAPVLIGPPGTGKTTMLNAVSLELTGEPTVRIPCSSSLGEEGLIARQDFRAGEGAFDFEGCIAEAFTGFKHSKDTEKTFEHGRGVTLDEISQLNLDKALGPIKDIRQAKVGKPLSSKIQRPVLPGSFMGATSNLPITDERLDREFGRVPTDYFEMKSDNPELYEFMLAKLLHADRSFPAIAKSELTPAYEDIPVTDGPTLSDGSQIIGKKEIVTSTTDTRHGILYRLSYAVRALQDAYIHGSKFNEKHLANTSLTCDTNDGIISVTEYVSDIKAGVSTGSGGGEMLTLTAGSSTLTAEIISKWIEGFDSRLVSKNPKDHTKTFTEWIQLQLENHIAQTSSSDDARKIRAIFEYWHLFDQNPPTEVLKPLTPKEVGYLSPRVPRPWKVEKPVAPLTDDPPSTETEPTVPETVEAYETIEVVLESGETVKINKTFFEGETRATKQFKVFDGQKFLVNGVTYLFEGILAEGPEKGKLVASIVGEEGDLHKLFTPDEVNEGMINLRIFEVNEDTGDLCAWEESTKA